MDLLQEAIAFATSAHQGQKRKKSGIPYVFHCAEVCKRVADYGISDEGILCSAVLHDVVEDCDSEWLEKLDNIFGARISRIVHECSRPERDDATKAEKYAFLESFKDKSTESIVIKISDRFCNVMDYHRTDPAYASKYALQAYPLYQTFISRHLDLGEEMIPRKSVMKILGDIVELNIVISEEYKGFSSFICNCSGFVKDNVI